MWPLSTAGLFLFASATRAFVVPNPTGKYNVSVTLGPLVDYSREEPDTDGSKPRRLMLSIFEPAPCARTVPVPYMPDQTAKFQGPFFSTIVQTPLDVTPLFLNARFPVCPRRVSQCSGAARHPSADDFPILLFSPGYSIPRLYYNFMASAIASEGFTVITIDHPGDTNFITYPDGSTSINNDTVQGAENILRRLHPRVADVSFILDQLSNATAMGELLPHRGPRPLPTDRVAMIGHSLGGIAAVLAGQQDSRLKSVVNWDGTQLELPSADISQPMLLMTAEVLPDRQILFDSFANLWPLLDGPKLWVDIDNATHFSFSDAATIFQAAGKDITPFADLFGTIAPTQMAKILVDYTVSWMGNVFADESQESWPEVEDLGFPEVSTVMADL